MPPDALNLCLLCRDIGGDVQSGLATSTCDLAEGLAAEGHTVHLISAASRSPMRPLGGVSVRRVSTGAGPGPLGELAAGAPAHDLQHAVAVYREVRRIHEDEQPVDAVLAPLWRSEGVVCALDHHFPTIVSCMTSLWTLSEIDPLVGSLADIQARIALERAGLKRGRYLHGLTQAALAKTLGDYALEPELTAVIGRGVRDRGGSSAAVCGRSLALLFLGRLEHRKGVDTLLEAVAELVAGGISLELTLAGPDAYPEIHAGFERAAASDRRLRESVRFTGAVSDAERDRLLASADIVCCPSRYESHGIVLLEAMMFGRAIVTCDAGGIGEVVDPGTSALVCPPDDPRALAGALRRLAGDEGLRTRLGAGARHAFEQRHTARDAAVRMQDFIAEVRAVHGQPDAAAIADRLTAGVPGDMRGRLTELLIDVLSLAPQAASRAAAELLDPNRVDSRTLSRLRAAARARPAPHRAGHTNAARVTVLVLTCSRPRRLAAALDSLHESRTPVRTIVLDNGSAPLAAAQVAAECATRPDVELHRLEVNCGCAGGRRIGVGLADTELILFLDDDAELLPGALDHLLSELDSHPDAGAITATVITPDGTVQHSGGALDCREGVAIFSEIGSGLAFDPTALPPTGPADWVPGTAVLMRRELLETFPIDDRMTAYYEDAEWCYRVSLDRPRAFRRSREALALHHLQAKQFQSTGPEGLSVAVGFLDACARFHARHGLLLAPAILMLVPEFADGSVAARGPAARLLMELVTAKGALWTADAWSAGEFDGLLNAERWRAAYRATELALVEHRQAALEAHQSLTRTLAARDAELVNLRRRHEQLRQIEQGGWWRLRGRILPLIRVASRLRGASLG